VVFECFFYEEKGFASKDTVFQSCNQRHTPMRYILKLSMIQLNELQKEMDNVGGIQTNDFGISSTTSHPRRLEN